MVKYGLWVKLNAKPGKEKELETLLRSGLEDVLAEADTKNWYAVRLNETTFGIFDTFANERGREAHLSGRLAASLMTKADDLLTQIPVIENMDILTAK